MKHRSLVWIAVGLLLALPVVADEMGEKAMAKKEMAEEMAKDAMAKKEMAEEMAEEAMEDAEMAEEMAGDEMAAMLSAGERAELVALLEGSRTELEELAARADGEMWSKKPAADRWSVGEVVEHLVLAEEGLFARSLGNLEEPVDPEWQTIAAAVDVAGLVAMLQDRSQKFPAPPEFVPKGEMSREELLGRYAAARAVTLDFVRRTGAPLKSHTATGPAGKMNVHQWLGLLAGHNLRHNQQIVEVFAQLGS